MNQLPKKLKVEPLKKAAIYRLIGVGKPNPFMRDKNGVPQLTCPVSVNIPSIDIINDPDTGRKITIKHVTGSYVDENGNVQESIKDIEFVRPGYLTVPPTEFDTYEYLERCNWNASNPHRNPRKDAIFERYNPEAIAEQQTKIMDVEIEAFSLFADLCKTEEGQRKLIAYYGSLGRDTQVSWFIIKRDIGIIVRQEPESFLKSVESPVTLMKSQINDAVREEIITFDPVKSVWKWKKEDSLITVVAKGASQDDTLFEFLMSREGKAVFTEIKKRLEA
jgi:hypothetical protein